MKDKAINSFSLKTRIEHNEKNQRIDINKWAFKLISKDIRPLNILELCCGTGRQSEYLINHYINSSIDLLDISQESLNHIKNSSYFQKSKISTFNIDMDEFFLNNKKKYDIIFVSYGLYYSKNIDEVLKKIKNSINQKGQFIVMGPHGNNNKEIFEIIESTGLKIDKKIKFTCTDFMYDKVINYLSREYYKTRIFKITNKIEWKNINNFISYWENSTFYDEYYKKELINRLKTFFKTNKFFINTKEVMLIIAEKN
tara:strand:- start:382 stop:1146 length:765 start_codon:yes stop_codon:yes gene_type:complete